MQKYESFCINALHFQCNTIFSFNLVTNETKVEIENLKDISSDWKDFFEHIKSKTNHLFVGCNNSGKLLLLNNDLSFIVLNIEKDYQILECFEYNNENIICLFGFNRNTSSVSIKMLDVKQDKEINEIQIGKVKKMFPHHLSRELIFNDSNLGELKNFTTLILNKNEVLLFSSLLDCNNASLITNMTTNLIKEQNNLNFYNNVQDILSLHNDDINNISRERERYFFEVYGNDFDMEKLILINFKQKKENMLLNDVMCSIGGCSDDTIKQHLSRRVLNL